MKKNLLIIILVITSYISFMLIGFYLYKKSLKNEKKYSSNKADQIEANTKLKTINVISDQNNSEKFTIFHAPFFIEADSKEIRNKIKNIISSSDIWEHAFSEVLHSFNKYQNPIFYLQLLIINSKNTEKSVENYKLTFNVKKENGEPLSKNEEKFNYELPFKYENTNLERVIYNAGLDIFLKDTSNFHIKEKILIDNYKKLQNEEKNVIEKVIKDYAKKGFFNMQHLLLQNEKINNNIEITGENKIINICKELIKRNFIWHVLLKNNIAPIKIDIRSEVILDDQKNYILSSNNYIPGTAHVDLSVTFINGSNQFVSTKQRTPGAVINQDPYIFAIEEAINKLLLDIGIDLYSSMTLEDQSTFFNYLVLQLYNAKYQSDSQNKIEQLIFNCLFQNPQNIQYLFPGLTETSKKSRIDDKCSKILKQSFKETKAYIIKGLYHENFKIRVAIADFLRALNSSHDKKNIIIFTEEEKEKIIQYVILSLNGMNFNVYDLKSFFFLLEKLNKKSNELENAIKRIINTHKNERIVKASREMLQKLQS